VLMDPDPGGPKTDGSGSATLESSKGIVDHASILSVFYNECEVVFKFEWKSQAALPQDVNVQVRNIAVQASKKVFNREQFFS
jgi:hypothetical protein